MARVLVIARVTLAARDRAGQPVETAPGATAEIESAEAADLIRRGLAAPAPDGPRKGRTPAETVDGGPEDEDA